MNQQVVEVEQSRPDTDVQSKQSKGRRRHVDAAVVIDPPGEEVGGHEWLTDLWEQLIMNLRSDNQLTRLELLLELVGKYRVLRTEHVREWVWVHKEAGRVSAASSYSLCSEAVGAAVRHGFLQTIRMKGEGRMGSALVLGAAGMERERLRLGLKSAGPNYAAMLGSRGSKLRHDLLISDFMVQSLLDVERLGGQLDWLDHYRDWRMPGYGQKKGQLQWDALGYSEIAGLRLDFYLELDHNRMDLEDMRQKLAAYAEHYRQQFETKRWQTATDRKDYPDLLVVTSGGEERLDHLVEQMAGRLKQHKMDGKLAIYCTTTKRIERAVESGRAHNPLAAPVWTSWNWPQGASSTGLREDHFPLMDYQGLLQGVTKRLERLLGEAEATNGEARAAVLERLGKVKRTAELVAARVQSGKETT